MDAVYTLPATHRHTVSRGSGTIARLAKAYPERRDLALIAEIIQDVRALCHNETAFRALDTARNNLQHSVGGISLNHDLDALRTALRSLKKSVPDSSMVKACESIRDKIIEVKRLRVPTTVYPIKQTKVPEKQPPYIANYIRRAGIITRVPGKIGGAIAGNGVWIGYVVLSTFAKIGRAHV